MAVELNRATFRRLVWLYLLLLPVGIVLYVAELLTGSWLAFSDDFDSLVERHFGPGVFSDEVSFWYLVPLLGLTIWMIASTVGLLWFKRWARLGVWASALAFFGAFAIIDGYRPSLTSIGMDLFAQVEAALLGAILLLAYARGLGADWFARSPSINED